jgi:hypothetical protein
MALQGSWVHRRARGEGKPLGELRRRVYRRSTSKDIMVAFLGFSALFSAITGARPEARKRHIRILSVIASRESSTWAMYDHSLWVLQG